jgi:opacity protein-like surface antigen
MRCGMAAWWGAGLKKLTTHRLPGYVPGIVAALIGSAAFAADLPVKAPVIAAPAPAAFSWTGCYVGGHVGGGYGRDNFANPTGFAPAGSEPLLVGSPVSLSQPVSGFLGGGQAGCKYEFAPNWVIGVGGDFSTSHILGYRTVNFEPTNDPLLNIATTFQSQTDWLASATANLGYVFNGVLIYAKGGAAWAHNKYEISNNGVPPNPLFNVAATNFLASETRTGWTAGVGLEYPFWKNLTATFAYDYYDFGTSRVSFVDQIAGVPGNIDVKQHINTVKFGLNYYFWDVPGQAQASAAPTGLITKAPAVAAAPSAMTWSETFSSEVRYFSWKSDLGFPTNLTSGATGVVLPITSRGSGTEVYTPYATELVGTSNDFKIDLLARGGWVSARQSTAGITGEVATATDTTASGTFTYLGLNGIQPFVSLLLNLPTGLASLNPNQVNARMDPDLVDIADFGEGLNIGPTLGFTVPLNSNLLVTASAGYTHRGTYEREGPLTPAPPDTVSQPTQIQPGDVVTLTGVVGHQTGPWSGNLTGTVTQQTDTVQNGVPFLQAGRRYLIAFSESYTWPQAHMGTTTLTGSASHSNRNQVLFQCLPGVCPTVLTLEPFNTNSNLYRIGIDHMFTFDKFSVGPLGSFLFRDHNGYDPVTLQFVPAKDRWSVGARATYSPNDTVTFNARVEHVWIHEDENPSPLPNDQKIDILTAGSALQFPIPVVSSTGWQVAMGATAKF